MPNKAMAGLVGSGAGSGVGGAIAVLILALWHNNDPNVASALTVLCSAAVSAVSTFFAVYYAPHSGTP